MAILLEIMMLIYYKTQLPVPLIKNKLFGNFIVLTLVNAIINLTATLNDIYYQNIFIAELLNVTYYILFFVVFFYIFLYGMFYLNLWDHWLNHKLTFLSPLIVASIVSIVSPWTHWIFYIDQYGYFHRGPINAIIVFLPWFYSGILLLYYSKSTTKYNHKNIVCVFSATIITLVGSIINFHYEKVLLMESFLYIAQFILYVTLENPEYYISNVTESFNSTAFTRLVDEYLISNKPFYCCGIQITNFESLRNHHGNKLLFDALKQAGKFLEEKTPNGFVFYTDNKCFITVTNEPFDIAQYNECLRKRSLESFKGEGYEIFFTFNIYQIEDPASFQSGSKLLETFSLVHPDNCRRDHRGICYVDDEVRQLFEQRTQMQKILQNAIKEKNVVIYMQPLYATQSQTIEGVEVLARINDPIHGIISPAKFIPLAEESGQIIELGLIVLEQTCIYLQKHDLKKYGLKFVNVNLSPVQFQDFQLVNKIVSICNKYSVDIDIFNFEITETTEEDAAILKQQFYYLNDEGASISLDDFGKGSANIERLLQYPFTLAKLDMSLVWNYFDGTNTIIEEVVNIFKKEHLEIVAEGVEEGNMIEPLKQMGCDYLQGYYFSKPMPAEDFEGYIKTFNQSNI